MLPSPWGTLPGKNILESPESCFQTSDQRMLAECRVVEFLGAIFQSSQFYGGKAAWLGRPLQRWDVGGRPLEPAPQTISFGKSAN